MKLKEYLILHNLHQIFYKQKLINSFITQKVENKEK